MISVEKYDKDRVYTGIDGSLLNYEEFKKLHPTIQDEEYVVYLEGGEYLENAYPKKYVISKYNIHANTEEEELIMINYEVNSERTKSTPLERIASALEFLVMIQAGDVNEF